LFRIPIPIGAFLSTLPIGIIIESHGGEISFITLPLIGALIGLGYLGGLEFSEIFKKTKNSSLNFLMEIIIKFLVVVIPLLLFYLITDEIKFCLFILSPIFISIITGLILIETLLKKSNMMVRILGVTGSGIVFGGLGNWILSIITIHPPGDIAEKLFGCFLGGSIAFGISIGIALSELMIIKEKEQNYAT